MKAVATKRSRPQSQGSSATGPSRSLAAVSSPPTTVELCGVPVHFPFKPYKCQESYMAMVLQALHRKENALLESPTGTGKTLCLLCATLAWQREQARLLPEQNGAQEPLLNPANASATGISPKAAKVPTIIYASRTHSQLSQVVRELRNTRYRPKHAVLGSRDQMCVHPKVKTATSTAADVNFECAKLAKERTCRYRNRVEGFVPPTNDGSCANPETTQPVMDMEDLVAMGKEHKVCPFYHTRAQVSDAELILVPYNYLFEKDARQGTLAEVQWDSSIVIFDEAHNLESFASESASFDITAVDIAGCIGEVNRAMSYVQAHSELADRVRPDNLSKLKAMFLGLEEYIIRQVPTTQSAFAGEYIFEIFNKACAITHANHHFFLLEVQKISDMIMDMSGGSKSRGTPKLDHFSGCIKRVFGESTHGRCLAKARAYRVHVTPSQANNKNSIRTLSYWCFAPSLAMQELADLGIGSILVTSGTLSPLPSYSLELGLNFPHQLENPHIIQDHQVHVRVIGKGVSGKLLTSTYERRETSEYVLELGNSLVSLARIIPGGMLIFFPSYGVMENCIGQWGGPTSSYKASRNKATFFANRRKPSNQNRFSFPHAPNYYASHSNEPQTPWKRLMAQKAIVVEPKTTSDLSEAISEFHKYLNKPKSSGCVLMGVCRGKISEGIDFTDDMCRAVVITGLPFAPYLDPKVKLKREYLDGVKAEKGIRASADGGFGANSTTDNSNTFISGAEWYSQQAHRAVNQAIGRVIRNKSDYGAVLLLDSRFGEPRNQIGLSKWLRPHIQRDEGFGRAIGGLASFYKKAKRVETELKAHPVQPIANSGGVVLEYEEEAADTSMTNIAIIRSVDETNSEAEQDPMRNATGKNESDNGSLFRGYIQPGKVLARFDLKDKENKVLGHPRVQCADSTASGPAPSSLKDVYNSSSSSATGRHAQNRTDGRNLKSAWSSLDGANPPREERGHSQVRNERQKQSHRDGTSSDKRPKTSAADFFHKARTELGSTDFSSVRKVLVAMKAYGDKKDVRSYMRSACDLVNILVRYDSYDSSNPDLLGLLSPLLPEKLRNNIMTFASKRKFEESQFRRICQDALSKEELATVSALIPQLASIQTPGLTQSFTKKHVKDAQVVLEVLGETDKRLLRSTNQKGKPQRASLVDSFLGVIPAQNINRFQALVHELAASKGIKRIKQEEAYRTGERNVEEARFRRTESPRKTAVKDITKDTSESNPEKLEERREMEAALMQAGEVQRVKRERIEQQRKNPIDQNRLLTNPYRSQKKPRFASASSGPTSTLLNALKQRDAKSRTTNAEAPNREKRRKDSVSPKKIDPVDRCLKQVESDAYIASASHGAADIARKIKSNVPKGVTCTVCEKSPKEPYMAPCHHHACLHCWLQWLGKSKTCPVCRAPATKESLAKMVFQTGGGSAPSLTQLCASVEDEADSSSEEELELI